MQIRINGQPRELPGPVTVQGLLEQLGYRDEFVAVAVNSCCIPRLQFLERSVQESDDIEILAPMAGG